MGLDDRDYIRGKHPLYCTCVDCSRRRLTSPPKKFTPLHPLEHITSQPQSREVPKVRILTVLLKTFTRILLNVITLFVLSWMVWYSYRLFTHQIADPLQGSLILLGCFVGWFLFIKLLLRSYCRVFPSFKLTVFALLCVAVIFAFAGVEPVSTYKDIIVARWETYQLEHKPQQAVVDSGKVTSLSVDEIARDGTGASTVEFIETVINVPNLKNPSYAELKAFLLCDKTDEIPYDYPIFVCDNFATTLQKSAKLAGWRCAKVTLGMTGYTDFYNFGIASDAGHALNAFETTDRGIIYIDVTGVPSSQPHPTNMDKVVDIQLGKHFIPISLFPESGWLNQWEDMGTVTSMNVKW